MIIFISKRTIVKNMLFIGVNQGGSICLKKSCWLLFVITSFLASFIIPNASAETTFQARKVSV